MKYKVLIPLVLCGFVLISWGSLLSGMSEKTGSYRQLLRKGDECYEKELYQQAWENYEEAFNITQTREIEDKILDSYQAFYEEQKTDETYAAYLDALGQACIRFPEEILYWERAIQENINSQNYETAMELCTAAEEAGSKSEKLEELRFQVFKSYELGGYGCSAYENAVNGYFTIQTGNRYARLSSDGLDYESLDLAETGGIGDDGIYLCRDMENRTQFMDQNGIIQGKVKIEVNDFGIYSEGYCSAKFQDAYCFIDMDGNILIDGLQYAGCFQNGKAVIQDREGRWALIDQEGKICSDYFQDIKTDYAGRYLFGEHVIARKDEKYNLYDDSLKKEVKKLEASDMDIPVREGLAAYCENGKWGFINEEGEVVIKPQYEGAKSFSGGVAGVCENGKWGFINENNQLIVDCQFYDVGYASDAGVCYVSDTVDYYEILKFNFPEEITG